MKNRSVTAAAVPRSSARTNSVATSAVERTRVPLSGSITFASHVRAYASVEKSSSVTRQSLSKEELANPLDEHRDGLEQCHLAVERQELRARQEVVQDPAELRRMDVVPLDADQQRRRRHLA